MLRFMFGEEPMRWEGESLETAEAIEAFIRQARRHAERQPDRSRRYITYAVWAEGLLRSMDELEQSRYAARRLAERIPRGAPDELTPEERLDY